MCIMCIKENILGAWKNPEYSMFILYFVWLNRHGKSDCPKTFSETWKTMDLNNAPHQIFREAGRTKTVASHRCYGTFWGALIPVTPDPGGI